MATRPTSIIPQPMANGPHYQTYSLGLEDLSLQGDADLADLAVGRLPAADLVGVELALGVEILPGFLELDARRSPSWRRFDERCGTSIEGDGLLGDARGQIAIAAAATTESRQLSGQGARIRWR